MLESKNSLRECIKKIFSYEYDNFLFGMQRSEFTDDIIDSEVSELLEKAVKNFGHSFYTVTLHQNEIVICGCDSQEALRESTGDTMQDIYIVHRGKVYIPDFEANAILLGCAI